MRKKLKMFFAFVFSIAFLFNIGSSNVYAASYDDHSEYVYVDEPEQVTGHDTHWHYFSWLDGSTFKEGSFRCTITYYRTITKKYCRQCGKLLGSNSSTRESHDFTIY